MKLVWIVTNFFVAKQKLVVEHEFILSFIVIMLQVYKRRSYMLWLIDEVLLCSEPESICEFFCIFSRIFSHFLIFLFKEIIYFSCSLGALINVDFDLFLLALFDDSETPTLESHHLFSLIRF